MMSFSEWAFKKCVIEGCEIHSIKDEKGVNIQWVASDGDTYIL